MVRLTRTILAKFVIPSPSRRIVRALNTSDQVDKAVSSRPNSDRPITALPMAYTSMESTRPTEVSNESPVIIMHGLMGAKGHWNTITKMIHSATRRKVIAVDARNHGDSEHSHVMSYNHLVEDMRAFMADRKIPKSVLIGHDMGGQAMMVLALKYPNLVDRLIVVDTSPISSSPSLYLMPKYFAAIDQISLDANLTLSKAKQSADRQLRRAIPEAEIRNVLLTNLVQADKGRFKWRMNLTAIARHFIRITTFPTLPASSVFPKATLFLGGGRSDNIKRTEYTDIRRLFPKSSFQTIDGAGHWMHLQAPNEFVKIVTEFMERKE